VPESLWQVEALAQKSKNGTQQQSIGGRLAAIIGIWQRKLESAGKHG
jgi:hypothetical protein